MPLFIVVLYIFKIPYIIGQELFYSIACVLFITIIKDKVKSKGEDVIADILIKSNIAFLKEYNFKDCKGKRRTLPFDFYLPNYNICIEYDGTPHYKLGTFKNGLLDLMNRKYLDDIKTKYCKDNNIELIRIPYWEKDNIEEILNHKIITR